MKLRTKLISISLAMVSIPVIVVSALSYIKAVGLLEAEIIAATRLIVKSNGLGILEYLRSKRERAMDAAAGKFVADEVERLVTITDPGARREASRELNHYLQTVRRPLDHDLVEIHILDLTGRVIASTDAAMLGDDGDRVQPYFLHGRKGPYIQAPYTHVHHGVRQRFLPVAAPIVSLKTHKVVGVLMNGYSLNDIKQIVSGNRAETLTADTLSHSWAPLTQEVVLFNSDKTMLVSSRGAERHMAGRGVQTEPARKCLDEGREIYQEFIDYRGKPVWGASACLQVEPGWRWALVVKRDKEETMAPVVELRNLFVLTTIIALLVAAVAAIAFAQTLSRPIMALVAGAKLIGSGNLDHKVGRESRDEIGELSRAFDRMVDDLQAVTASRDELNREVAERRLTEQRLREAGATIERYNQDLERFTYVSYHDLQEPLRMITSFTQLLAKRYQGRLDADADEFIGYAVEGANRMQRQINGLLAYSRVGAIGGDAKPVDCNAVLDKAMVNLHSVIDEFGATITTDPLPFVSGDETELVQVFQALIDNAVKFRRDEPPLIQVRVKAIADCGSGSAGGDAASQGEVGGRRAGFLFSVIDNGIGIDPAYFDRMFILFKRLHAGSQYPGTGIGLAICKKTVERHGGRIWVESEPGRGSTFCFTLPAS